jgi:glyoxylase-like metal-dependent hydrolase (beta-lactamase superfamily II)
VPDRRTWTSITVIRDARVPSRIGGAARWRLAEVQAGAMANEHTIHLGDATISRVLEWSGPLKTVADILPDASPAQWQAHRSLLAPDFWDPDTGAYLCHIQTWVVRVGDQTVLIDTGVGNDRDRPQIPPFANLHTDFLDRLATVGVDPAAVDIVINTHIHYDHVGWNTRLVDGAFVPTFPNATYLVPRADYEYFHPDNAADMRAPQTEDEQRRFDGIKLVFNDSIAPIEQTGQLLLWDGQHSLAGAPMTIEAAPGHTPGSSVVTLRTGQGALFVGDLLHSPMQILHPEHRCSFDLDPGQARSTRRRVLARAAAEGSLLLPAHLSGHSAGTITATPGHGTNFAVDRWADFPRHPLQQRC